MVVSIGSMTLKYKKYWNHYENQKKRMQAKSYVQPNTEV